MHFLPDFPSLAIEIAEPHPDMNIKVAAFTVSEKSSNTKAHIPIPIAIFFQIIPKDAWNQDHGTFCCYFWRFGEWELVVIDDRLPVIYGNVLWGAKSKDDPNEMWPALVEKAFAK